MLIDAELVEALTDMCLSDNLHIMYEGCLKCSWTHIITPSRNFVEVR